MTESFDVVVGCGRAGAATTWLLARNGIRVLAIDRLEARHTRGSSHGTERIIRRAYGDGERRDDSSVGDGHRDQGTQPWSRDHERPRHVPRRLGGGHDRSMGARNARRPRSAASITVTQEQVGFFRPRGDVTVVSHPLEQPAPRARLELSPSESDSEDTASSSCRFSVASSRSSRPVRRSRRTPSDSCATRASSAAPATSDRLRKRGASGNEGIVREPLFSRLADELLAHTPDKIQPAGQQIHGELLGQRSRVPRRVESFHWYPTGGTSTPTPRGACRTVARAASG